MPRITIIVVYFGSWPQWISAWLRSCSTNAEFRWIIFTDLPAPDNTPANVHITPLTPAELEARVSAMLETPFTLSRGYKLVDLKPAYGELFQDYLKEFDHWGYTDLDVIYGDLARFFPPETLSSYDILSPSDRLLVGHLTLLRNTPHICRLYRQCPDFLEILCRETHAGFDEKGFHQFVMHLAEQRQLRVFLRDMKAEDIILRLSGRQRFLIVWYKGRLYDFTAFRQICHFHFMESKWKSNFRFHDVRAADELLTFTPFSLDAVRTSLGTLRLLHTLTVSTVLSVPWYSRKAVKLIVSTLRQLIALR